MTSLIIKRIGLYIHDLKIRGRIFTGRKGRIIFTTGLISKDLRPSANILRHRRRWGSWSFLGTRWHSRICCWTRDNSLWSILKNKVAVSEFVSVSVSENSRNLALDPSLINQQSSTCKTSFNHQSIALPIFKTQRFIIRKALDHIQKDL